jgi:hypothetical protein
MRQMIDTGSADVKGGDLSRTLVDAIRAAGLQPEGTQIGLGEDNFRICVRFTDNRDLLDRMLAICRHLSMAEVYEVTPVRIVSRLTTSGDVIHLMVFEGAPFRRVLQ